MYAMPATASPASGTAPEAPDFSLEPTLLPTLPPLAWCLQLQDGETVARIRHGAEVLVLPDAVVEGCWAGPLTAEGLLGADVCAATGVALQAGALWLCTPTHTVSRLHSLRHHGSLFVSNSMALVCAAAGLDLDPGHAFYKDDLSSIQEGLALARRTLPLAQGHVLQLHYHCNVRVTPERQLKEQPKRCPDIGADFEAYRALLRDRLGAALRNAADPQRPVQLRPISTLSRGYDSVTCTVLAREFGCEEVLCFRDPSATQPDADNGSALAVHLGLRAHVAGRTDYQALDACPTFLATGTGGEDVFLAAHAGRLRHRVLITGFHGDKVWDRHGESNSPDIVRGDPSGADLEEFRLAQGFFHLPLPFVGCQQLASIRAISRADALADWRVEGDYDRPICRRIGEEAGLARASFGQRKCVMSRAFAHSDQIAAYLGPQADASFRQYLAQHPVRAGFGDRLLHALHAGLTHLARRVGLHSWRMQRAVAAPAFLLRRHADDFEAQRALFPWAFAQQRARYVAACSGHDA